MPKDLMIQECKDLGINFPCNQMENGEYRFRCMDNSSPAAGWGYILTKMPMNSFGWQNSHHHNGIMETYIVQKGWIGFAELLANGKIKISVYRPGELFTTMPGHDHNVFMSAGSTIHTVKHGDCSISKDWIASPELDIKTKNLSESDILNLADFSEQN
jgi:hypothetical protein